MIPRRWLTVLTGLILVLGVCRVACANSLSPYIYFWPGVISISFVYAFPASLLAAFLERPFLTAAGIRRSALVFSLRANFLSTVVGILLVPIGQPALFTIGPLWSVVAFGVSCVVEIFYLRRYSGQRFTWGRVIGGNAVSSVVLMVLPPIGLIIGQAYMKWGWSFESHEGWLTWSAMAASVAVFLASFKWWPIDRGEMDAAADSGGGAGDVALEPLD